MRRLKPREDSLNIGLSFFLILGSIAGSIICNGMSAGMKADLYTMERSLVAEAARTAIDFSVLFFRIFPRRLAALLVVCLILSTQVAPFLLMIVAGYLGGSVAALICPLTMDAGFAGLWKYILLVFPQCLIYIPIVYVLIWWMPANRKRLTPLSVIVLVAAVALGSAAESLVNPWFLQFL